MSPTLYEHFCDRCGKGPLTGSKAWHDGHISVGSLENMKKMLGREDYDTEVILCDPCYRMFFQGVKAFMGGGEVSVRREPPDPELSGEAKCPNCDAMMVPVSSGYRCTNMTCGYREAR